MLQIGSFRCKLFLAVIYTVSVPLQYHKKRFPFSVWCIIHTPNYLSKRYKEKKEPGVLLITFNDYIKHTCLSPFEILHNRCFRSFLCQMVYHIILPQGNLKHVLAVYKLIKYLSSKRANNVWTGGQSD